MEFHNQEFGLAFRPSSMSHTHDSSAMQLGTSDVKACILKQCLLLEDRS